MKERLHHSPLLSRSDFVVHFVSGMTAETVSCIIYVPVDVIKERMQVQQVKAAADEGGVYYTSTWDAIKQISRTEGIRGIYRGYAATLGSFGPFSALYFVFYEKTKFWARQYVSGSNENHSARSLENVEIPFPALVVCSGSAGAAAAWLTSPLDMAKLRLQVQRGKRMQSTATKTAENIGQYQYRGVVDCLRWSYQQTGVRGLFKGAAARVFHVVPATTVTMTAYETCRSFFRKMLRS
jgi:hypothetical protein